jgi:hypothetical protein
MKDEGGRMTYQLGATILLKGSLYATLGAVPSRAAGPALDLTIVPFAVKLFFSFATFVSLAVRLFCSFAASASLAVRLYVNQL